MRGGWWGRGQSHVCWPAGLAGPRGLHGCRLASATDMRPCPLPSLAAHRAPAAVAQPAGAPRQADPHGRAAAGCHGRRQEVRRARIGGGLRREAAARVQRACSRRAGRCRRRALAAPTPRRAPPGLPAGCWRMLSSTGRQSRGARMPSWRTPGSRSPSRARRRRRARPASIWQLAAAASTSCDVTDAACWGGPELAGPGSCRLGGQLRPLGAAAGAAQRQRPWLPIHPSSFLCVCVTSIPDARALIPFSFGTLPCRPRE